MPVCIAGMHRSGTSAVAKLLMESGLYLGPEKELMPPSGENAEGFWEHLALVDLNEEILNQLGGGWDCPPPPPDDWASGVLAPLLEQAKTIVAPFTGHEPWGWKDPRNSLTLPFWQTVLGSVQTLLVIRNPLEVALSLRQRNGFTFALSLTLWQIYSRRLLESTTPADRVVTHFDAYFADPETELRRVLPSLQLDFRAEVATAFRASTGRGLRHHRTTIDDMVNAGAAPEIVDLYRLLCEEARWREPQPSPRGAGVGARSSGPKRPVLGHVGGRSTLELGIGRIDRAEEIRQLLLERENQVDELELTVQEQATRLARLAEVERLLSATEQEVAALRQAVSDQAEHLDIMGVQLETLLNHEQELRGELVSAHEQLSFQDAEVMGLLGAALSRYAPGAPAAIYYRQLLQKVKEMVATHLPAASPVAVIAAGDDLMLELDGRPSFHFPPEDRSRGPNLVPIDNAAAVAQLELLRARGAAYLVVPGTAQAWLVRHPEFDRYMEQHYPTVVKEIGACVIYALAETNDRSAGIERQSSMSDRR